MMSECAILYEADCCFYHWLQQSKGGSEIIMQEARMNKKKLIIGGAAAGVVLAAAIVGFVFLRGSAGSSQGNSENLVYVDSVASITGLGSGNGMINRFAGVVEPRETIDIKVSSDKTVKECYVKEGDEVKKGQKLFMYDTSEAEENLSSKEIEVDRIKMDIETYKANVESLKKEKANASSDEQLDYTVRIQSAENNAKRSEYELKSTQQEIEQLKKSINEAVVTSEIDGVVKSINDSNDDTAVYYGGSDSGDSYMTLLSTGQYRIKGTINEQNMGALSEGDSIIIHSRVDENKTWTGTLSEIDMEHPENSNNDGYYMSGSSSSDTTSSNSYPFYVDLDSDEDLMLGQHVYMERDEGQLEEKEGLWLASYYIVQEDDKAYVWAAGKREKIEKREITLGEYDEELDEYQVTDGLTEEDYIAYPDESVKEGAPVTKNIEDLYGSEDDSMGDSYDDSMLYDSPGDSMMMEGDMDDGYVGLDDSDDDMEFEDEDTEFEDESQDMDMPSDMPDEVMDVGDTPAGEE